MGLFNKKEQKSEAQIPELPRLPRLSDFQDMEEQPIHQLPSLPSNSLGKKFSRDSIKDAVSGERGEKDFYADEISDSEIRMMREPLRRPMTEEMEDEEEMPLPPRTNKMKEMYRQEAEPVFVRIDKFEEGLKIFTGIKNQLSEIEKILEETKRLKEKEEAELNSWENELKRIRGEIEKMGNDIFSKV